MHKLLRYVIPLSETDEIWVHLTFVEPGRLSEASVHYRAFIRNQWHEVSRYDNAHGFPHRHRFWLRRSQRVFAPSLRPEAMVELAKTDFKQNWVRYRALMEAQTR